MKDNDFSGKMDYVSTGGIHPYKAVHPVKAEVGGRFEVRFAREGQDTFVITGSPPVRSVTAVSKARS